MDFGDTDALGTGVVVAIGGARYTHSTLRAWQLEHFGREPSHCSRGISASIPESQTMDPGWLSLPSNPRIGYHSGLGLTYPRLLAPAGTTRDRNPAALLRARPRLCRGPARVLVRPGGAFVVRDGDPDRACHGLMMFCPRICGGQDFLLCRGCHRGSDRSGQQLIVEIFSEP